MGLTSNAMGLNAMGVDGIGFDVIGISINYSREFSRNLGGAQSAQDVRLGHPEEPPKDVGGHRLRVGLKEKGVRKERHGLVGHANLHQVAVRHPAVPHHLGAPLEGYHVGQIRLEVLGRMRRPDGKERSLFIVEKEW